MALKDILDEQIKSNLSVEEQRFYGMDDVLSEKMGTSTTDFSRQAFQIIQSSVSGAQTASIDSLEMRLERLENLKRYVSSSQLGDTEKAGVFESIEKAEKALTEQLKAKKSYFTRAKKLISENTVDVGALLIGMSANDPLVALGVKLIGDKLRARKERKLQAAEDKRQANIQDAEALKETTTTPNPIGGDEGPSPKQSRGGGVGDTFGGSTVTNLLQDIFLFTEEISTDVKKLIRIEEGALSLEQKQALEDKESLLESSRIRPGSGAKKSSEAAKGGILSSLTSMFSPGGGTRLLTLVGKHGLVLGAVGATLYGVYDIFDSYFKTGEFGNSDTEKLIRAVDQQLLSVVSSMGPGAAAGAKEGSQVVPLVGTLVGGLLGIMMGKLTDWFDGAMPDLGAKNPFQAGMFAIFDVILSTVHGILKATFDAIESIVSKLPGYRSLGINQALVDARKNVLGMVEPLSQATASSNVEAAEKRFQAEEEALDLSFRTRTGDFSENSWFRDDETAESRYKMQKDTLRKRRKTAMEAAMRSDVKSMKTAPAESGQIPAARSNLESARPGDRRRAQRSARRAGRQGKLEQAPAASPGLKGVLDIIASAESGAAGYNAMNQGGNDSTGVIGSGHSQKIIGKNLTDLTVGEVLDAGEISLGEAIRNPNSGRIFAAGRYQIIPGTLQGLVNNGVVSEADKFDEITQDKLGMALLEEKGIPKLIDSGRFDEAQNRIAKTWAGIGAAGTGATLLGGPNKSSQSASARMGAQLRSVESNTGQNIRTGSDAIRILESATPRTEVAIIKETSTQSGNQSRSAPMCENTTTQGASATTAQC